MWKLCVFLALIAFFHTCTALHVEEEPTTYSVKFLAPKSIQSLAITNVSCHLLHLGATQTHRLLGKDNEFIMEARPQRHEIDHEHDDEEHSADSVHVFEIFSHDFKLLKKILADVCSQVTVDEEEPDTFPLADEVVPIVKNGDPANRIDLVFMGDGYTTAQRTLFFDDMNRLVKEMFQDITFASYLPVFNIWALYRASTQSGIGVGGVPLNTAFGLYRDGTELRGIYCSKASTARSACQATGTCDFPTLIGNDAYYGGLGGEFTISTSSKTSGTLVLRHEMGHNFASVGEEYDGGSAYSGANSASSVTNLQWTAWLTEPSNRVAQQSVQRVQNYAWYDLAKGAYTITFTSDGTYSKAYLIFSASGCEVANAISVTLDGVSLGWVPGQAGILDRLFYPFIWDKGFSSGTHTLVFTQVVKPATSQIRQLCNVNLHEYKASTSFHFENTYVGAYPTWSQSNRVTYRPTNEFCLMRNMTSPYFCPVCQEAIWIQFFKRMSLIDNVTLTTTGSNTQVSLALVKVAQLRPVPIKGESFLVNWFKNNVEDTTLRNITQWTRPTATAAGSWRVTAKFITPEVRSDPSNLLTATKAFTI
jgi:hypothetical protein